MVSKHHLWPRMEHYGCVTSLLSLSGHLDEDFSFILTMPYELDAHINHSLLHAKSIMRLNLGSYYRSIY